MVDKAIYLGYLTSNFTIAKGEKGLVVRKGA